MAVEISNISFSPASVVSGQPLTLNITVTNNTAQAIQTFGPDPSFVYNEGQNVDQFVPGASVPPNSWRIGVDYSDRVGTDHPYRWGLGQSLDPGQSVTLALQINLFNPSIKTYWVGLVEEWVAWHLDNQAPTQIAVTSAPNPPPPSPAPPLTGPWRLNVITDGGAVGDGIADDSDAIINTFDQLRPGGWLEIPPPPVAYKLTRTWLIDKPVRIECGFPSYDYFAGIPQMTLKDANGTKLLWGGTAGDTMVYITPGQSDGINAKGISVSVSGLILDCAGIAAYGLKCDRLRASVLQDIITLHATEIGIVIGSTSTVANDGGFQSSFHRLRPIGSPIGLSIRAFDGGNTGAYYCFFYDLTPDSSQFGLEVLNGDNNCFINTLSNQLDRQNGVAVHIGPSGLSQGNPNLAYHSYFFHGGFEGGIVVDANNPEAGLIIGYDKVNGESEPIIGEGSELTWVEAGRYAQVGRRLVLG